MSNVLSMPAGYYDALRRLTAEVSGVLLGDTDYKFTIETRLAVLARAEGFPTLIEMVQTMFSSGDSRLAVKMVAAMMQRDSHFFKDRKGFEALSDIIMPELYKIYGSEPIKVLLIGINSGQEAYSVAIMLDKLREQMPNLNVELTAIEYASQALDCARAGRYSHFDVQRGLPIRDLLKYFNRSGEDWVVKDALRDKINFQETHLLKIPDRLGQFHAVICRGVLSRMLPKVRARFMRDISGLGYPFGYLLIGSDEDIPQTVHLWKEIEGPSYVFQRVKTQAEEKREMALQKASLPAPSRFLEADFFGGEEQTENRRKSDSESFSGDQEMNVKEV